MYFLRFLNIVVNMKETKLLRISIITICYNTVDEIEQTLLSVLNQTYPNIEYIVIDGCSTDGTVDIINKYIDRITTFISEPDKGIYDAMNKGLHHSTGDWVNFMNSGDIFYCNDVISKLFKDPIPNNVRVIYGNIYQKYRGVGSLIRKFDNLDRETLSLNICHQASFTDGTLLRSLGFDLKYKIASDLNTFYQIQKQRYVFEYRDIIVAVFDATDGVSQTNIISMFWERVSIQGLSKMNPKVLVGLIKKTAKLLLYKIIPQKIQSQFTFTRLSHRTDFYSKNSYNKDQ